MDAMWIRSEAMENHSKRKNVRLVGLNETFGTKGTLLSWVQKISAQGVDFRADAVEFEIESASDAHTYAGLRTAPESRVHTVPKTVSERWLRMGSFPCWLSIPRYDKLVSGEEEILHLS